LIENCLVESVSDRARMLGDSRLRPKLQGYI